MTVFTLIHDGDIIDTIQVVSFRIDDQGHIIARESFNVHPYLGWRPIAIHECKLGIWENINWDVLTPNFKSWIVHAVYPLTYARVEFLLSEAKFMSFKGIFNKEEYIFWCIEIPDLSVDEAVCQICDAYDCGKLSKASYLRICLKEMGYELQRENKADGIYLYAKEYECLGPGNLILAKGQVLRGYQIVRSKSLQSKKVRNNKSNRKKIHRQVIDIFRKTPVILRSP